MVPADTRASAVAFLNLAGYGVRICTASYWGVKQSIGIRRIMSYTSLLLVVGAVVLFAAIRFLVPSDYERVR